MKLRTLPAICVITLLLSVFSFHKAFGNTSTSVNASIKIAICGDGNVDTGENCDGTNLDNKTCVSLGYGGGTLSCDISCSFDTSQCIPVTPTPTPLPTATPTPVSASTSTSNNVTSVASTPTPTTSVATFPTLVAIPQSILPSPLQMLVSAVSDSGRISISNLPVILKVWVTDWKNFRIQELSPSNTTGRSTKHLVCDLDNDGMCDITDLSILLYYVGK